MANPSSAQIAANLAAQESMATSLASIASDISGVSIPDLTTELQNIVTAIDNLTSLVSSISIPDYNVEFAAIIGKLQNAVTAIGSLESNMDVEVSNQDLINQYVELIIDVRRILKVMEIAQYGGKSITG
jgi:hypothetical protein